MTIAEQLHKSATHAKGNDPNCPVCLTLERKLKAIIADLKRCADENEADAKGSGSWDTKNFAQATAVAAEQRRMIKVLKGAL
jgi:hypothetical protein